MAWRTARRVALLELQQKKVKVKRKRERIFGRDSRRVCGWSGGRLLEESPAAIKGPERAPVHELLTEPFATPESLPKRPFLVGLRVLPGARKFPLTAIPPTAVARTAVGADGDGAAVDAPLVAPAAALVARAAGVTVATDDAVAADVAVQRVTLLLNQLLDLFVVHRAAQRLAVL